MGRAGRSPKQPLPGMGLHDPPHGRQACPEFIAFDQGFGQICLRRGYFRAVSYQNGDKFVTSPPPAPIVERVGGNNSGNISYFAVPWEAGGPSPLKPARL